MRTAGVQSNLVLLQRAGRLHAASVDATMAFPPDFSWEADDKDSATVQAVLAGDAGAPGDDDGTEGSDDEDAGATAADDDDDGVDGNDNDLDNERDANDLDLLVALDAERRECEGEDPANAHFALGYYESDGDDRDG
jgi:hypothetical protein